ncbi:MAG: DUF4097 family beta strand repeat-containing protein [Lachnospiraceae bacterium]|nr:DUF4097 family beta strand repeat-containing protein [Lachnospiraceae bacterium]
MTTFQKVIKYLALAFAIFLSISIISGILQAFVALPNYFGKTPTGEMKAYTFKTNFTELKTDLTASSLEIKTGDSFKVESNLKYLDCREDGNCLIIKETKKLNPGRWKNIQLTLTVPEGTVFSQADIDTGAGEVSIEKLAADSLSLTLGAGELQGKELIANNAAKIDGGAGSITITDCSLHNADIDMGIGELHYTGTLTGNSKVDYGVGETNLTLTGSEKDYQIILDKGVGDAIVNGMSMGDNSTYGNGVNRIEVDGGVGDLNIMFQSGF